MITTMSTMPVALMILKTARNVYMGVEIILHQEGLKGNLNSSNKSYCLISKYIL